MSQFSFANNPTALEVIDHLNIDRSKYVDAVVLITGASAGIGIETARAFASLGAILYLTVRDIEAGNEVVKDIEKTNPISIGKIHLLNIDLTSLNSVRQGIQQFIKQSNKLNILITNAGVMACPEGRTVDGFETQFGVNHLAHFLLTYLLLPILLQSSTSKLPSRVVTLTSSGHNISPIHFDDYDLKKAGYDRWIAYGQSKTANIYMATEIERRFANKGIHALAVHPGGVATKLGRHMQSVPPSEEEMKRLLPPGIDMKEIYKILRTPEQGAATSLWAALNPEFDINAGYYCENCSVGKPKPEGDTLIYTSGYAPYTYDTEAAKKLWEDSLKFVNEV